MSTADVLDQGRADFSLQRWGDAYTRLSAADREAPLAPDDLERLAAAAYLIGNDSHQALSAAVHSRARRRSKTVRQARIAAP